MRLVKKKKEKTFALFEPRLIMTLRGEQRMKTVVDFLRSMRACVNGEHVVGTTKRSEDNLDDAIHGLRCKENASTLIDWYINNAWSRVLARFMGKFIVLRARCDTSDL